MRRGIITLSAIAVFGLALLPSNTVAQTAKDLVGVWSLVSNVNIRQDGTRVNLFGPNPKGMAIYDSSGRFAVVNLNPDVPKFASNNRAQGTAAENKAAVEGSIGLFGTYTVSADKVISMKVEGSTYPNWTGTEQKRNVVSFTPDEFKWTLAASVGGTAELVWRRIK